MSKYKPVEFRGDVFVINTYGYYESKRTGQRLNRVIWEIHHGPMPEGYKAYFQDGVRSNYAIENLYLKKLEPRPFVRVKGVKGKPGHEDYASRIFRNSGQKKRRAEVVKRVQVWQS